MSKKFSQNILNPNFRMMSFQAIRRILTGPLTSAHQSNVLESGSSELVIVEKLQTITTIGINRPSKRNCVNHATALQLEKAFRNFEKDDESPVAVLYGKGGTFCSGYDLSEVAGQDIAETNLSKQANFDPSNKLGVGPMGPSRRFISKPVIAAISGFAVAGGLELALMCDLRVVEETAVMGVFCRRFGVPLIDGGTLRLPHLVGLSRAMDLILTGRPVSAKEALEIGLANRFVACGTSLGQGIQLANEIAKFPQNCLNTDRLNAYNNAFSSDGFYDSLQKEMQNGLKVLSTESAQGATRFIKGYGRNGSFNMITPASTMKS